MADRSSSPGKSAGRTRFAAAVAIPLAAFLLAFAAGRAGREAPVVIGPASAEVESLAAQAPGRAKGRTLPALAREPRRRRARPRRNRSVVRTVSRPAPAPSQPAPAPSPSPAPAPAPAPRAPAPRPAPAPSPTPDNGVIDDSG